MEITGKYNNESLNTAKNGDTKHIRDTDRKQTLDKTLKDLEDGGISDERLVNLENKQIIGLDLLPTNFKDFTGTVLSVEAYTDLFNISTPDSRVIITNNGLEWVIDTTGITGGSGGGYYNTINGVNITDPTQSKNNDYKTLKLVSSYKANLATGQTLTALKTGTAINFDTQDFDTIINEQTLENNKQHPEQFKTGDIFTLANNDNTNLTLAKLIMINGDTLYFQVISDNENEAGRLETRIDTLASQELETVEHLDKIAHRGVLYVESGATDYLQAYFDSDFINGQLLITQSFYNLKQQENTTQFNNIWGTLGSVSTDIDIIHIKDNEQDTLISEINTQTTTNTTDITTLKADDVNNKINIQGLQQSFEVQATAISELNEITNNLANDKADDMSVVHKDGSETISGLKTFSRGAKCENLPTQFDDYCNKAYVDSLLPGPAPTPTEDKLYIHSILIVFDAQTSVTLQITNKQETPFVFISLIQYFFDSGIQLANATVYPCNGYLYNQGTSLFLNSISMSDTKLTVGGIAPNGSYNKFTNQYTSANNFEDTVIEVQ